MQRSTVVYTAPRCRPGYRHTGIRKHTYATRYTVHAPVLLSTQM